MITVDYEHKYKDALERAKKLQHDNCWVTSIFPELAESEDERIRKKLIEYFTARKSEGDIDEEWYGLSYEEIITYLKKQKEHKPSCWNSPVITHEMIIDEQKESHYIKRNALFDKCVENCDPEVMKEVSDKVDAMSEKEQKPVEKFRVGDMIISTKNPLLTYKILEVGHINELGNPEYKVEIFEDGKPGIMDKPHNIHYMECHKVDEWGKLIEHQPAEWSEEDEHYFQNLIMAVDSTFSEGNTKNWLQNRFKSLRPQPHWRPSEEQKGALNYAYCELFKREDVGHNILGPLQNLIDTLSKL